MLDERQEQVVMIRMIPNELERDFKIRIDWRIDETLFYT